jgi:phage terminase large subunit-like protein
MRAGPKAAADLSPLPLARLPKAGGARVVRFVERFLYTPKGVGARKRLRVRPWQANDIAAVFDDPRPRAALWSEPRGNGKSTIAAALGLYGLYADGVEGASVPVVARDERQAGIVFNTAVRMVERELELLDRTQVFQDRLYVPSKGSMFRCLPAEPRSLEGLDPSLAIIDEIGVVDRRVYEVVAAAMGKRPTSLLLMIGTPSPDGADSVMWELVEHGRDHDDPSFRLVEYGARSVDHPLDCSHCWEEANPALGDFLAADSMRALLPKLRESTYRRARLGQWVDALDEPWLAPGLWDACASEIGLDPGVNVVLALDGSHNMDATALVGATITDPPHLFVVGYWEPQTAQSERALTLRPGDDRVVIADVEQTIRDAARRYRVHEVVADPYLWQRSLEALAADGLRVLEYPQSMARMGPATSSLYQAVLERTVTHDGDPRLDRHVAHVVLRTDSRGSRVVKDQKHSARRVDLAVAAVMAHSRAVELCRRPSPSTYVG